MCHWGKKKYQRLGCGMRSISGKVVGVCHGLKWISATTNREADKNHMWKHKFMNGHYLQKKVDVGSFKTWVGCCTCEAWATSNNLARRPQTFRTPEDPRMACQLERFAQGKRLSKVSESLYVNGRRVSVTKSEIETLCEVCDEGFGGIWCRMEKEFLGNAE